MKAIISIITISAAAALLNAPGLRAQDTAPEPSGLPQTQEAMKGAQDELARAQVDAQREQARAQKAQAEAKADFAKARQQMDAAQKEMAQANTGGGGAGTFSYDAVPKQEYVERLQNVIVRAPDHGAGRALVIRSSESDPKEQTQLEEDLAVMSRILEKASSERFGGQPYGPKAMGIDVFNTPAASPLRSLYLDGYGALFMLNVGFPLLPPPHAEGQQEKPEANSDWEDAKQELYGQPVGGGGGRFTAGLVELYDEERVNRLKDGLLDSLKNATNIRGLKADDSITVCVLGGPTSGRPKGTTYIKRSSGSGEGRGTAVMWGSVGGPMHQTILSIRVKKSDADALAKGAMTLEAFRKRAHVVTYAGGPEGGMGAGAMGAGMGGMGGGWGGGGSGFGGGAVGR